jgi:predicted MPP superfamily phosphohydrolase
MCRRYSSGLGLFNSGVVYVSRGVGGVELPIRTFAPPDVFLLDLIRRNRAESERHDPGLPS